jgi:aldehyde:ferredoxin oxidoreductase
MGCVIACSKVGALRRGPHQGTVCENVEYESQALMGANLGMDHLEGVAYACHLCDTLGLDTMSAGAVIGWTMEALERGHLSPADVENLDLTWGNYRAVHRALEMIAHRRGIGDLLAEGVKRASERVGQESYKYALHTKGLEIPGYDPRGLPAHGLGYMTGDKGGEHVQGYTVGFEAWGGTWRGRTFDRFGVEGKAELVIWIQNLQVGTNTLVKCDFTKGSSDQGGGTTLETFAEMLSAVTGSEYTADDLLRLGERIFNLTRLFNLREGFTRADDDVAYRCRTDPLPDPGVEGRVLTRQDLDYMLDDYYRLRGWDERGLPSAAKLEELGLAEDGQRQGII